MNILMLYPNIPDTFWSFKHAIKMIGKKTAYPPLGLLTIAGMLPDEWGQRLVDLNVEKLKKRDLEWADVAFISGMVIQRDGARQLIKQCRDAGVKVVAGGPLFSTEYPYFEDVDHFFLGEAEQTMPYFIEDLKNGTLKKYYQAEDFPDLEETPKPKWELIKLKRYASMSIQYSRGCPFNCEFCNVTSLFGHKPRTKTASQTIDELESLWKAGWRGNVFFVDDNLLSHKQHLKKELLPRLIEWQKERKGVNFNTEISINVADDEELLDMLVKAGFDTVFIGIETPNEESLTECNKQQNTKRNLLEDVKKLHRAGLQVQGGFIVGFDNDTPSIFQQQIDFIQNSGVVTAMVGMLEAVPGTHLYERLKKEKRLLDKESSGDNVDGTTNIIPTMNCDTLVNGYKSIMEYIYSPENFYQRVKTFLKEYETPDIRRPLSFERVVAFLRSIVKLGILSKGRLQYWKLLLWTSVRRPKLFPLAVTLMVYGYHFRKTFEAHMR